MENTEKVEKKQWSWALLGDLAILTDCSGKEHSFDINKLTENPDTKRLIVYYGVKQFITDKFSAVKDETEKISAMRDFYDDIIEKGLEIVGKGMIALIGKERANRKVDTWESETLPKLSTFEDEDLSFMLKADKMGMRKLSETFKATIIAEIAKRKETENPTE